MGRERWGDGLGLHIVGNSEANIQVEDDELGRGAVEERPGSQEESRGKPEVAAHTQGRELSKSKVWTAAAPDWKVNWALQHQAYGPP